MARKQGAITRRLAYDVDGATVSTLYLYIGQRDTLALRYLYHLVGMWRH